MVVYIISLFICPEKATKRKVDEASEEEKKLAVMMMPRKKRKLYDKIMYSKKKKASEVCSFRSTQIPLANCRKPFMKPFCFVHS